MSAGAPTRARPSPGAPLAKRPLATTPASQSATLDDRCRSPSRRAGNGRAASRARYRRPRRAPRRRRRARRGSRAGSPRRSARRRSPDADSSSGWSAMTAPAAAIGVEIVAARAQTQWASVRRGVTEAQRPQPLDHALRIGLVGEGALVARLEQMHVHAPAGLARASGDRGEQRRPSTIAARWVRTARRKSGSRPPPRSPRRARSAPRCSSGGCEELPLRPGRARRRGSAAMRPASVAIDQRIAVAHEDGERHAHADVGRRAGDFARLLDRRHRPVEAGVVRHDRAGAAARRPPEGGERAEIGIDRRHRGEAQEPGLERLARRAERGRRQRPAMIVRVDERRHGEPPPRRRLGRRRDRGDRGRPR